MKIIINILRSQRMSEKGEVQVMAITKESVQGVVFREIDRKKFFVI